MPVWRLSADAAGGALLGIVTEIVAVRPVLKSLDQHLYVLSTLALALMIQQFTAIEWSTEPQPFPRMFDRRGGSTSSSGCRCWPARSRSSGSNMLYRRTLVGHAFLAIAEDNYAARALGLPERNLRIASYALAGVIGALAGFAGGEMLLAFFANAPLLNFYGFVPVALGGMGNNRGAVVGGLALGLFQQAANFLVGGIFASVAVFTLFIVVLLAAPKALPAQPRRGACDDASPHNPRAAEPARLARRCRSSRRFRHPARVGLRCRFVATATGRDRAPRLRSTGCWSSGLNLVVGFAGQLAIGWVALLTLGAYTTSVLAPAM
jgi:branched-chain amino acid transport system permease protein